MSEELKKFDRKFIEDNLFGKVDWDDINKEYRPDYRDKLMISLMFELCSQLALLNASNELPDKEESGFRCPKCREDKTPNRMGYCPDCKTDLAAIYPDKIHIGKDVSDV